MGHGIAPEDADIGRGPACGTMTVAYIVAEFPSLSETFIVREILGLQEHGVSVAVFALVRPAPDTTVHGSALDLLPGVVYRAPLVSWPACRAHVGWLLTAPGRYLRVLARSLFRMGLGPVTMLKQWRRFLTGAQFAWMARERGIEHVHAHFAFVPADVAAVMADLLGSGFSVSAHAWDIYAAPARVVARRLEQADFVVACTRDGRARLKAVCPDLAEDRIVLMHHGVFPEQGRVGEGGRDPLILAVGRLVAKKGFEHLVDACARLRERAVPFRCVIVGDGPCRVELDERMARHGLGETVDLQGALDEAALAGFYARACVFVLPSVVMPDGDRDGLPNAVLEALAAGLPVVSTTASAANEAIDDGVEGYLVAPADPDALADRIESLLTDRARGATMGERGQARVRAAFDVRKNTSELARRFFACGREGRLGGGVGGSAV